MNNDELKKKIVDIALHAEWTDMFGDHNSIGKYAANAIADALIAAGIGDVKDLQAQVNSLEITNIALQAGYDDAEKDRLYWVNKYKEAEHRAEVAEDVIDEFVERLKAKESPKLLTWEYGEGYSDCIKIAAQIVAEMRQEVEK